MVLALLATLLVAGCGSHDQKPKPAAGSDDRGEGSVSRIERTALHVLHAQAKEPVPCEGCHEQLSGQYLQAASWRCQKCHAEQHLTLHATTGVDSPARTCWSCHDFTSTDTKAIACMSCHDKPAGSRPAIKPHDPKHPDEDCGSCHKAHQDPTLVATVCESCHKEPVTGHPPKAGVPTPTGCASCHGYHEAATVASGRCTNCHRQSHQQVSFKATFAGGHVKCVTCHRPHRFFKNEVIGCRDECHKDIYALSEYKVAKHRGCIGCHDNHNVRGKDDPADRPEAHCVRCHTFTPQHPKDKASKTPCLGCHKPHKGAGTPVAADCSSCHTFAISDRAFHQGAKQRGPTCRDCHRPHDFAKKDVKPTFCLGCHGPDKPFKNAPVIRPFVKHSDCFRCHGATVPHAPAGKRVACVTCHTEKAPIIYKNHANCVQCHDPHTTKQKHECGFCHKDEAGKARLDHKNCIQCHEPHSTKQKKPCGECHALQASTAPEKHQQCMNCHDQHSTLVKKACKECHADRATGVHAPVKGGCLNCHRPHAGVNDHAKPPQCTSCHDRSKLPGLHQKSGHATCTKCHRSHGEQPNRKRATCVACHKDRKTHEPDAPLCFGCHVFRSIK